MKFRIRTTKSKMYSLVSDKIGGTPKMKDTEFKGYMGAYWLEYRDVKTDHIMKICLDSYGEDIYMIVEDRTEGTSDTLHLNYSELEERDIIKAVG